jgi:DNA-binding response OmpR family regulator
MPKRILIAEDQLATREALIQHAKRKGYDVVAVANGIRLVAIASVEVFDVVITDLIMPDLNGVASIDVLKFKGNTTPVIALTGLSPQDTDHFQNKFTKIFHKPVDISELFEYLETLLGKSGAGNRADETACVATIE